MTESTAINASLRKETGKTGRRLYSRGLIPAVLYGLSLETTSLSLPRLEFERFMQQHAGSPGLVRLNISGTSKPVDAMVKQVQKSTLKSRIIHVDFLAIRLDRPVQAVVTLHFVGEVPAAKEGGIILHEIREVTLEALPANLPNFLEVDMSGVTASTTMTVADIVLPKGVTILDDPDGIICSVTTSGGVSAEESEVTVTEPEIVGSKSKISNED